MYSTRWRLGSGTSTSLYVPVFQRCSPIYSWVFSNWKFATGVQILAAQTPSRNIADIGVLVQEVVRILDDPTQEADSDDDASDDVLEWTVSTSWSPL